MKKFKYLLLSVVAFGIMTMGILIPTTNNADFNITLEGIINKANATCENYTPGLGFSPCYKEWCPDIWMYNGCGMGNGPVCSERKSC